MLSPSKILPPAEESEDTLDALSNALGKKSKTFAKAAEWISEDVFEGRPVNVFEEDVVIDGNLELGDEIYAFLGDLTVSGTLLDNSEYSLLLVAGSLRARNVICTCQVHVGGDVTVEGVVFAESSNDYFTEIGGTLTAAAVIEYGHTIEASKIASSKVYCSNSVKDGKKAMPRSSAETLRGLVGPQFLDGEGVLNDKKVKETLLSGGSPLL